METLLNSGALLEILSVLIMVALFVWRLPTKEDSQKLDAKVEALRLDMKSGFQRVDERFERQDAKFEKQDAKIDALRQEMNADFQRVDERFEAQRIEFKADLQRVEDRAAEANVFHARSVELLDAIRQQLSQRGEPL